MKEITIVVPAGCTITGINKDGYITGSISATKHKDITVTANVIADGASTILEYSGEDAYILVWCHTYKIENIFEDDPIKEDE